MACDLIDTFYVDPQDQPYPSSVRVPKPLMKEVLKGQTCSPFALDRINECVAAIAAVSV